MFARSMARFSARITLVSMVLGLVAPLTTHAAGAAVLSLTGPGSVSVGQVFSVAVRLDPKGEDIDTVRINGTYPKDQVRWIGATLGSDFPSSSPNTYFDEGSGNFSIGAFRLGSGTRKITNVATITFRARANGNVKIIIDGTSRAISAGENRLGSANSLTIAIGGKPVSNVAIEQPVKLPTKEEVAEQPSLGSLLRVWSTTHPDPEVWYRTRDVSISWESAGKNITSSLFSMDGSADSTPTASVEGQTVRQSMPRDGIWFAHVKTTYADGTTQVAHLRLQIDATPPRRPVPLADQDLVSPTVPNAIRYGTTDDASGVEGYRIALAGRTFDVKDTSYPLPELEPGVHVASVTAIDRAGNESSNDVSIEVVPVFSEPSSTGTLADRLATWWAVFGRPSLALVLVALVALLLALPWVLIVHRKKRRS